MRFLLSDMEAPVCSVAEGLLLDVTEAGSLLTTAVVHVFGLGHAAGCLPAARRACSTAKNSASGTCTSTLFTLTLGRVVQNLHANYATPATFDAVSHYLLDLHIASVGIAAHAKQLASLCFACPRLGGTIPCSAYASYDIERHLFSSLAIVQNSMTAA